MNYTGLYKQAWSLFGKPKAKLTTGPQDKVKNAVAIRKMLAHQLAIPYNQIYDNSSLSNDLNMDSLDQVENIMNLEERYNAEISDYDAEKWRTVQDIINWRRGLIQNTTPMPKAAAKKTDLRFSNNDIPVVVKGQGGTEYDKNTPDGYNFAIQNEVPGAFEQTYGKDKKHWNSTQKGSAVSILLSGLLGAGAGAGALSGLGYLLQKGNVVAKDSPLSLAAGAGALFGGLYGMLGAGVGVQRGKEKGRYGKLRSKKEQEQYNQSSTWKEWLIPGEASKQNQLNGRYAMNLGVTHPLAYKVTGKDPGYTQESLEAALESKDPKVRHAAENFMENLALVSMGHETDRRIQAQNIVDNFYGGGVDFRDPKNLYEYIHAQPYELDDYDNEPLDYWKRIILEKLLTGEPIRGSKDNSVTLYGHR